MSTEAEIAAVSDILAKLDRPIIIDVGACGGEDSEWMRAACGDKHSLNVMVEPDRRNVEIIRQHRRGTRTMIIEAAIADYTGMVEWYEATDARTDGGRSGSGSIHKPTNHLHLFPEITFAPPMPKMCWSLDHLCLSMNFLMSFIQINLLWVDVQGAERELIQGAGISLAYTDYLFIEAELVELYEGQAKRHELLEMLPDFRVIGEFEYNLLLQARRL